MTDRLRAVLDTNVYVSAFLSRNPTSPTRELIERWKSNEYRLLISDALADELIEKLLEKNVPLHEPSDERDDGRAAGRGPEGRIPVGQAAPDDSPRSIANRQTHGTRSAGSTAGRDGNTTESTAGYFARSPHPPYSDPKL